MESKNRVIISIVITLIFVAAILTSLGRTLFSSTEGSVGLPTVTLAPEEIPSASFDAAVQRVDITPSTVQAVIATLAPPQSYYRMVSTSLYYGESVRDVTAEVWHHHGVSYVRKALPSGAVRIDMIDDTTVYYWYEGDDTYLTTSALSHSTDLALYIPTYQTVLDLEVQDITVARYEMRETIPCIYVEATVVPLGYSVGYWVSLDTGLLVESEMWDGEFLIYRMNGFSPVISPIIEWVDFTLPDGTQFMVE